MRGALLGVVLAGVACVPTGPAAPSTSAPPSPLAARTTMPLEFATPTDAVSLAGGCGTTPVWKGSVTPALQAAAGYDAPSGLPVVIAEPPILAGFLFAFPLRAGRPENPANKILWVVATGRSGPLVVEARPLGSDAPSVRYTFPDSSGPGSIYPSGVDVPTAGCWHLTFGWDDRSAALDLLYR